MAITIIIDIIVNIDIPLHHTIIVITDITDITHPPTRPTPDTNLGDKNQNYGDGKGPLRPPDTAHHETHIIPSRARPQQQLHRMRKKKVLWRSTGKLSRTSESVTTL